MCAKYKLERFLDGQNDCENSMSSVKIVPLSSKKDSK